MRREVSLREAAAAAEELASALLGFSVRKAIDPLTEAGFLLIGELVAEKLAKAAAGAEAAVVIEILEELDLDWGSMTAEAAKRAMTAVNTSIAASYTNLVLPKLSDILVVEGPKMMKTTRLSVIAREKIEIAASLSERDLKAEETIRKSHLNFVRDSSGARADALSERAREYVALSVEQGLGTDAIGTGLKHLFDEQIPRPGSYWRVVADAFLGRARTTSQVSSYEDAGIETYEIVAVLDEVTTDICRMMDGKVFRVSAARGLLDSLESLENPEDVKYANPWVRKGLDKDGEHRLYIPKADGSTVTIAKIERSGYGSRDDRGAFTNSKTDAELVSLGIAVPPFHGSCRTTIVAGVE